MISGQGCVIDLERLGARARWSSPTEPACTSNLPSRGRGDGFGFNRTSEDSGSTRSPQSKAQFDAIKDEFKQALAYDKVVAEAAAKEPAAAGPDPRLAALIPYAKGEKPVIFTADYRGEILDAIELAKELKLKAVITGGLEAWKVAAELKAANVPVLIGGTLCVCRSRDRPLRRSLRQPCQAARGRREVRDPLGRSRARTWAPSGRNLPYEAAMAVPSACLRTRH